MKIYSVLCFNGIGYLKGKALAGDNSGVSYLSAALGIEGCPVKYKCSLFANVGGVSLFTVFYDCKNFCTDGKVRIYD